MELPLVAFPGLMHTYHWFMVSHPACTPPTRASVGAFHAHEGGDGDDEEFGCDIAISVCDLESTNLAVKSCIPTPYASAYAQKVSVVGSDD